MIICSAGYAVEKTGEIPSGYSGTPMNAWDPFILREGSIEHLFFGNLFCKDENGSLSFTKNPKDLKFCKELVFAIGYGFRDGQKSKDFTFRSTPVFLPSADSWDNNYVETPSVVKRNNTYYLAYSAWPKLPENNMRYQIGMASLDSTDLMSDLMKDEKIFKRLQDTPIIPRNNDSYSDFDRENTQEPSLIYNSELDRFEIYYVGIRGPKPLMPDQVLAGIEQLALGRACFDPSFKKIECSENLFENPLLIDANMPEVVIHKGQYVLVYSDLGELKDDFKYGYKKIPLRFSDDGVTWSKPFDLLSAPFESSNESAGIHSASITIAASGEFNIIYQGWGLFAEKNCVMNGVRIMIPYAKEICHQTSLVTATGWLPLE